MLPIHPIQTYTLSPNNSSVRQNIPVEQGAQWMIYNAGVVTAFLKYGTDNTVVADNTGVPVPPGAIITLTRRTATYIAVFSTGAPTVYVTAGEGE